MITCRLATLWISRALDVKLPWFQRIVLGLHRGQCRSCRRFGEQIALIDQSFAQFADSNQVHTLEMTSECRARINAFLLNNRPKS